MSATQPFNPRLVIGLIAAGVTAFAAMLLLIAYGGNFGSGRDGRAHALSVAAVGFKGLVSLVGEYHETYTIEGPGDFEVEDLVVIALEEQSRPEDLARLLDRRTGLATLIILPKWLTVPDPERRGWVRAVAPVAGARAAALLGPGISVPLRSGDSTASTASGESFLEGFRLPVPGAPQLIAGKDIEPMVALPDGGILVGRLGDQPHYVVADPDILNNHGLRNPVAAQAALRLIEELSPTGAEGVGFDLTVNGLGGAVGEGRNLLRVVFEPPFLVMTLALLAAALLAGLHGAFRFGPARREERAIAFGKTALVENSAGLIRLAGREARLGGAYADVVRQEAARTTGAPAWLRSGDLDSYLNRLSKPGTPGFSELAARVDLAQDRQELMAAARALFQWKKDIIR